MRSPSRLNDHHDTDNHQESREGRSDYGCYQGADGLDERDLRCDLKSGRNGQYGGRGEFRTAPTSLLPSSAHLLIIQDELAAELEALEQEELDDRLKGADHVPVHTPASPVANGRERQFLLSPLFRKLAADLIGVHAQAEEDDEEAQLRQLQAELAM